MDNVRHDRSTLALPFALLALLPPHPVAAEDPPEEDPAIRAAVQLETAFSRVAERVFPSIVAITTFTEDPEWTAEKRKGPQWVEANREELLYPGFRKTGAGSGFVVAEDGHILSSHDGVTDDEGEIARIVSVELPGDHHLPADVVATEPTINLSILKIDLPRGQDEIRLRALAIGDSDDVQVGHWAIAVGDPTGAERTYATGTVSAKPERQCYQQELTRTLLQAAVRVHPESYGGPMLNIRGEVVGITVPRPDARGVAVAPHGSEYALPINLAMGIYQELKATASRRSPWLGVSVLELDSLRRHLRAQGREVVFPEKLYYPGTGVYVDNVFDPSPASRAGVRAGDFLVKIDGHLLFSVIDFQKWLYLSGIGKTLTIEIFRDGEPLEKTVTIEARPKSATTR